MIEKNGTRHRLPLGHEWARELDRLRSKTEPRGAWFDKNRIWAFKDWLFENHELSLIGRQFDYPFCLFEFEDNLSGDVIFHSVGAWEIKEAYAVAVSLLHGGKVKPLGKTSYEYVAIERMLEKEFGHFEPRSMIALCHWALHDLAPARFMYEILRRVEGIGEDLSSPEMVFDMGRSLATERGLDKMWMELLSDVLHEMETEYRLVIRNRTPDSLRPSSS